KIEDTNAYFMSGEKAFANEEEAHKHYMKSAKPIQLGCLVYGYSRRHVYNSVLSKVQNKYYGDTDSIHLDMHAKDVLELFKRQKRGFGKFHMGSEFGDFEDELNTLPHNFVGSCPHT